MKYEILLIALLCTVKATRKGSIFSKIDVTLKKQIDDTDSSIGSGDDDDDRITDSEVSGDDSSGDDVDEYSGASGNYSKLPKIVRVKSTLPPAFKQTTGLKNVSSTVININLITTTEKALVIVPTKEAPEKTTAKSTIKIQNDNDIENVDPKYVQEITPDDLPAAAAAQSPDGQKENAEKANFTVAIVVGVVVGAILSILIIVFLVYRLRKKDEGSYILDEPSSAMLRADPDSPPPKGKGEYFA